MNELFRGPARPGNDATFIGRYRRDRCGSRKTVAAGGVLFLLVSTIILGACGHAGEGRSSASEAASVAVVKAVRKNLSNNLQIASEFQPFQEIEVYAKVSGYIQKLYIDWGSHVKQGQLLAVLEIPELEQQVQQDEALVRRSQQDQGRAHEELIRAESAYNVANLTYTRLADVQKTKPDLVAQEEVDVAEGKDRETSAEVSSARDAVAAADEVLLSTRAALEKDRALYNYARITAPFDGVITELFAYTGALLPAGTSSNKGDLALCRLSQNDLLRLVIPVPERSVPEVHVGQTVAVNVSGNHKEFDGQIVRFSGQIDTATRTMHTEVDVPNPNYELVPGMYATVTIPLRAAQDALTLPLQSVHTAADGATTAMVVNSSDRIELRAITTGLQTATDVQILSGLQEGDLVVFGEQAAYKVGEIVRPKMVTPSETE